MIILTIILLLLFRHEKKIKMLENFFIKYLDILDRSNARLKKRHHEGKRKKSLTWHKKK